MVVFSLAGVISGILVFIITKLEYAMYDNSFVDVIAPLQYPLYVAFTTPLFGGNILFNLSYEWYALLMALFYGIVFGLTFYFK
ncbi:hypothetical protein [Ornithinibacillus californiensis]|uniref:hypothetical protein n=1 Tax=Ornithinibacillus californiensis TaxID=161536 RepID=UPI00064DA1B7|nr:hypothetical protein [Ornithinibacillus californiensis]